MGLVSDDAEGQYAPSFVVRGEKRHCTNSSSCRHTPIPSLTTLVPAAAILGRSRDPQLVDIVPDLFKFPVHAKTSSRAKGVCGRRYTCDAGLGSGVLVNATCKSIVQNLLQLHAAATSENQQRQRQRIYKCFHHLRAVNPTIRLHYYG